MSQKLNNASVSSAAHEDTSTGIFSVRNLLGDALNLQPISTEVQVQNPVHFKHTPKQRISNLLFYEISFTSYALPPSNDS